jgi:hypothetical protein
MFAKGLMSSQLRIARFIGRAIWETWRKYIDPMSHAFRAGLQRTS